MHGATIRVLQTFTFKKVTTFQANIILAQQTGRTNSKRNFPNTVNEKRTAQGNKIARKIIVSAQECTITLATKPTKN